MVQTVEVPTPTISSITDLAQALAAVVDAIARLAPPSSEANAVPAAINPELDDPPLLIPDDAPLKTVAVTHNMSEVEPRAPPLSLAHDDLGSTNEAASTIPPPALRALNSLGITDTDSATSAWTALLVLAQLTQLCSSSTSPAASATEDPSSTITITTEAVSTHAALPNVSIPAMAAQVHVPSSPAAPLWRAQLPPTGTRWYVVTRGLQTGVFGGWHNVQPLVSGFPNACFQRYSSEGTAREAYRLAEL